MFFNDIFTWHSVKQIENPRFSTHHIEKHKIILAGDVSRFNFIEKYPLKFHSNYKYLVSYRATAKYFNK